MSKAIPYIDMHCDTLMHGVGKKAEDIFSMPDAMVDLERLSKAGVYAQFFAVFFPPKEGMEKSLGITDDDAYFSAAHTLLKNTISRHGDLLAFAGNAVDAEKNHAQGKVSAFLTMEDGRAVQGSFDRLRYFYNQGVRLISLTWNFENCFGAPNSKDPAMMNKGLTAFGKEAVGAMNEMGIIVDVSHLSDGGFWDVVNLTRKPFVASHSNCRALTPHTRNLTDEMIRALAEKGGVAGLNFAPEFLWTEADAAAGSKISRIERMCAHLSHLIDVGGEDCAAIGTDFDGISGELEVGTPTEMGKLFEALSRHGFSDRLIEKIAYQNTLRVIRETM
ncbi:MAG: dipeptidase [Candidatus Faecivivens sp.]|nr:dipeptidase [Oscillospiraceae bacterium]MDY2713182.1 dipeptidase [Candidatus Faecivivens sp.]